MSAHAGAAPAFVALGGGHGLSATLSALRLMSDQLTAVVTVADDGGSSGRLRDELGVLPPGDLRMALAALCDDSEWGRTWRDVLQHRFSSSGDLDHHAVGNLLIVALWELLGDTVEGLDWVAKLLGARGRVLPMAAVPLEIEADVDKGDGVTCVVRGQSAVAVVGERITQVRLVPEAPPACPEAVAAVEAADWVVLGPGSWFTSVLPHLLVPELADALHRTAARRVVVLNLAPDAGETDGMRAEDHIDVLHRHAPDLRIDAVVADPGAVEDVGVLVERTRAIGARLLLRQVGSSDGSPRHDPLRLAAALRDVVDGFLGDVGTRATDS
ncbi:gluconeogenesis factor YvcK family protein [Cellulomonas chengniuliangii]|uniref:Putative gluconeogenesis factor n=1 Tax=Cellulomonas chengniuliangii TaxID=2968084 RepID=A0ABY5L3Z8_9CELL|nr:uridine diphosphate-N-acetylglucosamine-binding protein YvcK [Cellulomonas chengniuliangii]MCC2308263.1 uridine diphosphate-N-acetylglucosamine-binding protein YvcK [Cellulomonas chengniuliangii]MCC2317270.1 uridine diphosphate-N-acetylglucosamine-binding protein YvcK [Cellulomonas chengniuliangii]UUI76650.1 uridine diphosphate-N-acetylglucosamine-binding protein YvcK [Cellulomonas chengniuliangii]